MLHTVAAPREAPPFDSRRLRTALGAFATGVTVVTTHDPATSYGMTANAFSSVSLVPPLVLVCVDRGGRGSREIARRGRFAVNILDAGQEHLSRHFARPDRPRGRAALDGIPHRITPGGSLVLDGVAGYFECDLHASHDAGDHTIFLGAVTDFHVDPDASALVFHRGGYRCLA